jgi:hypothetical protein
MQSRWDVRTGGERAAAIYSLIGSASLDGIDPEAYLTSVMRRIADQPDRGVAALETVGSHSCQRPGCGLNVDCVPLESKLFTAGAYAAEAQILYLRFRSGGVYRYFGFPPKLYRDFLGAESKGPVLPPGASRARAERPAIIWGAINRIRHGIPNVR